MDLQHERGGPVQGPLPSGPVGGDYDTPAQVGQWLAQGIGQIVGHPYVDGHHTIELSISAGPAKTCALFADSHTYQVVRTIDYFNQIPGASPITANYQWTPRSSAMVKLVNHPAIPSGYTQVAPATRSRHCPSRARRRRVRAVGRGLLRGGHR